MYDEEFRENIDLSFYRLERAKEDLNTARNLSADEDYRAANNRAYYSIFHSMRAVLALNQFDSKKHSGIISEFRRRYIKTGVFPGEISDMIDSASVVRNASDYNDMFIASKKQTENQIEHAGFVLSKVTEYLGLTVDYYKELFGKEGSRDSEILNLLLVSLFSSDKLITIEDCNKSERELMKIKWAIENVDLSEERKAHWYKYAEDGLEIVRSDREELEKK